MKVVLLGNTRVGKTSMLARLTNGVFKEDTSATIGAAFQTHVISSDSGCITMQIWDTAGQEKYRALAPMYYRSANVAVLCFDLTNRESFQSLELWVEELVEKGPSNLITVLVGTKLDLVESRVISSEEAESFASRNSMAFYGECSAKTGIGVNNIFTKIAEINESNLDDISVKKIKPEQPQSNEKSKCC
ncbi:Ras- protein Rab-12 [Tritrichomonas musculus]|uniref:Ras- protein Rab-12 n=1 Tax=Tritrichomonas musculus TaxID=1915356 RepID=A0ABR2JU57_9EUKA